MNEDLEGVKISQLPQASSITDSSLIPGVVGGETKAIKASLLKGQKGDTGPAGPQGPAGEKGEKGDPGEQGPQGVQGEQGIQGPEGPAGIQGPQGIPGEKGEPGTGIAISGEVATYADLPTNLTEADAGNSYIVKADGLLYIWSGTSFPAEGDGTSFVGPKGDKGDKGDTGEQGPAGEQGPTGAQGEAGPAGPQGEPGPKGDPGEKGEKGDPGAGLTIAGEVETYADLPKDLTAEDAGKAYINKADSKLYVWTGTAFPAEGEGSAFVGPQGPKGDTGDQGPKGDTGDQGVEGPQGPQGIQGEKGVGITAVDLTDDDGLDFTLSDNTHLTTPSVRGPQGIQGPKGDTGEQGPQGEQGIQGEKGEQGIRGPQGEQGPQGIQGEPGQNGSDATVDIQQTSGDSTTSVMSQKAVTTAIANAVTDIQTGVTEDLKDYYTKTETDQQISTIPKFAISVVDVLPTENISATTVYLVPSGDEPQNVYTEYIYVSEKWEKLGTQTLDLTGYYTKEQADSTFATQVQLNDTVGNISSILETI